LIPDGPKGFVADLGSVIALVAAAFEYLLQVLDPPSLGAVPTYGIFLAMGWAEAGASLRGDESQICPIEADIVRHKLDRTIAAQGIEQRKSHC
jgi:hypothetical protein